MDSSNKYDQTIGTIDTASDLFADLSPRAQAHLADLSDWFEATEGAPLTSGEAESREVSGAPAPGGRWGESHPWSGAAAPGFATGQWKGAGPPPPTQRLRPICVPAGGG